MGLAILMILAFHANDMPIGALNNVRAMGFAGVDIFVLVSGMGLALSLLRKRQRYGDYLKRRLSRILPAYYAVMVPLCVYNIIRGFAVPSALFWNLTTMHYWARPLGAFNWYITGIMTFYLLTPAFVALIGRAKNKLFACVALCAASYGVLWLLLRDGWWQYCDVFYRFPTLFMGIYLGFAIFEEKKEPVWVIITSLVPGAVYAALVWRYPDVLTLAPVFSLFSVPACLALAWALDKIPAKPLAVLGECSLEIYLLNVSLVEKREGLRRFLDFDEGHFAYYAIMLVVNIAGGIILHRVIVYVCKKTAGLR